MRHRHHTDSGRRGVTPPDYPRRKTAVITDDGTEIALVLLDASLPSTTGVRFSHRGRTWEICGSRQGSRVLVAGPVVHPRQ